MSEYEAELEKFKEKIVTANQLVKQLEESNEIMQKANKQLNEMDDLVEKIDKNQVESKNQIDQSYSKLIKETETRWDHQINTFNQKFDDVMDFNNNLEKNISYKVDGFEKRTESTLNKVVVSNFNDLKENELNNLKSMIDTRFDELIMHTDKTKDEILNAINNANKQNNIARQDLQNVIENQNKQNRTLIYAIIVLNIIVIASVFLVK